VKSSFNAEFNEGKSAFENGIALDENPYKVGSAEADAWQMGWNQGVADAD